MCINITCFQNLQKTREVQTGDVITNARAQSISRGLRKKKNKFGKVYFLSVCYKSIKY